MTSSAALTTCLRWLAWPLCDGISIVMDRATLKQELEKVIAVGPGKADDAFRYLNNIIMC